MYCCGPTVYWYAHIGNMRTYLSEDFLRRTLEFFGYKVKHIMNITDVGHLTSDADTGEDKLEVAAKRERKTAWEVAEFYTKEFLKDFERLNLEKPDKWIKATDTIQEQIDLVKKLEEKGFTYTIEDGVYFDTSKLEYYGRLWPQKRGFKPGARVEMVPGKKNPTDFALWKFTPKGVKRDMEWDSPWGKGFPGWHTECVVMSIGELGIPFDIHCGGIDHIEIHHTNEIAQAEAAYGKLMARYWWHGEHLILKEGRMGKSEGNIIRVQTLIDKGFHPLSFRYLALQAHYRSKLVFSWQSLESAQKALLRLWHLALLWQEQKEEKENTAKKKVYLEKFKKVLGDDINTPQALALFWEMEKDKELSETDKLELLLEFDKVFGLRIKDILKWRPPEEIRDAVEERQALREQKRFDLADLKRQELENLGYLVHDTEKTSLVFPKDPFLLLPVNT